MNKEERYLLVPVWEKSLLTVEEAAAYTNINPFKLRQMSEGEDCEFVLWNGTKRLFKRKKLDEYLEKCFSLE